MGRADRILDTEFRSIGESRTGEVRRSPASDVRKEVEGPGPSEVSRRLTSSDDRLQLR